MKRGSSSIQINSLSLASHSGIAIVRSISSHSTCDFGQPHGSCAVKEPISFFGLTVDFASYVYEVTFHRAFGPDIAQYAMSTVTTSFMQAIS